MDENKLPFSSFLYVVIFLIFVVFFTLVVWLRVGNEGQGGSQLSPKPSTLPPAPTNEVVGPSVILKTLTGRTVYEVGEEVEFTAFADSRGVPIVSFDLVGSFNPAVVEFVSARSIHSDFNLFETHSDRSFFLTGYQKEAVSQPTVFSSTAIALVRFKLKGKGEAGFKPSSDHSGDDGSKLMNGDTRNILRQFQMPIFYVGEEIQLQKGRSEVDLNKSVNFTLRATEVLPSDCVDCIESATISIRKLDKKDEMVLDFFAGGIDGRWEMVKKAYGLIIEVSEIKDDRVILRFSSYE